MPILPHAPIDGIRCVILDLDDTLLDTTREYYERIEGLADQISGLFPGRISRDEIIRLQEKIDVGALANHGFTRERFPSSFVMTYESLAGRFGRPVDRELSDRLYRLGDSVYDNVPPILPGVEEELTRLKEKRYELILYTLGSEDVQRRKIRTHDLERYFDDIHIVLSKEEEVLASVCGNIERSRIVIVGDSLRGEIQPGLALGLHAIHVKRQNGWTYLDVPVEGNYFEIRHLPDLRGLL